MYIDYNPLYNFYCVGFLRIGDIKFIFRALHGGYPDNRPDSDEVMRHRDIPTLCTKTRDPEKRNLFTKDDNSSLSRYLLLWRIMLCLMLAPSIGFCGVVSLYFPYLLHGPGSPLTPVPGNENKIFLILLSLARINHHATFIHLCDFDHIL